MFSVVSVGSPALPFGRAMRSALSSEPASVPSTQAGFVSSRDIAQRDPRDKRTKL